jgi:hypothetical protein
MNQQVKMFLHFLTWCIKSLLNNIKNFFLGFLQIREILTGYVKHTCDGFRQSFSFGLLGYMLSLMTTMGICSLLDVLVNGAEKVEFFSPTTMSMFMIALCINTVFHFACFAYVMYERFLEEYSTTWNILKDKE